MQQSRRVHLCHAEISLTDDVFCRQTFQLVHTKQTQFSIIHNNVILFQEKKVYIFLFFSVSSPSKNNGQSDFFSFQ